MPDDARDDYVLIVETANGAIVRRVQAARALPVGVDIGPAAEDATRDAAGAWGLPDFVFRSVVRPSGSGVRELGDAIVTVGNHAAVVQVKAREAAVGDEQRERNWLDRRIAKAARQAMGTIKAMSTRGAVELINLRGRHVTVDGAAMSWVPVVVLDHPGLDNYVAGVPAVVLLRREWEFLFEQLKSTHAVIGYLHRVRQLPPEPLGREIMRYYDLADADAQATPRKVDARLLDAGAQAMSHPILPQAAAGSDERQHHMLVRMMLEDIANSPLPDHSSASDLLDVLAAVDSSPVGYRTELGKTLLDWLNESAQSPAGGSRWNFRHIRGETGPFLLFATAAYFDEVVQATFGGYVRLRHQELLEAIPEIGDRMTVGVLLTPRSDGLRPWDTTTVATHGDQGLDAEQREALEALFNNRSDGSSKG